MRLRSLQAKLSVLSLALFVLIAGFGLMTIQLFNQVNVLTDELRQVWLPSTRLLGDLNNISSDDRAAEGDTVLAQEGADRRASMAEMARLTGDVARTQAAYQRIAHSAEEQALYQRFATAWQAYTVEAARVAALSGAAQHDAAIRAYRTTSRAAYNAASDALGVLTSHTVEAARAASARTARAYEFARFIIPAALLAAFALLLAALGYVRSLLSRPLVDMAATMHRLAANDTDIAPVGMERDDEIGEMSRALLVFRANAIALMQSQQGLAQQAAMLEQKLALERQLTQMQRDFVVMVSHEFRTPLTIIDAHAQRLISQQGNMAPATLAERGARIRFAVQRMTALMENMLTTGRMIDGETKLFFHPVDVDVPELLQEVCAFHRETAPNAYIGEDFRRQPCTMTGDRKLLFQAFSNLLSNAIKYSVEDVFVTISLAATDDLITVTVRDRGVGIAAQDLPNLFTQYFRGGNSDGFVGTGVGLFLVRTVAELHGGGVGVQSAPGQGSCFTITLPRNRPAARQRD